MSGQQGTAKVDSGRIGGSNRVMTMREAADYLHRSYKNFAANYKGWEITPTRIGRRVYFLQRHLDHFIERNTRPDPDKGPGKNK
jgi:hypothetical protein